MRALILMRNRGTLTALEVLPTLFRLFRCQDKALRQLLFRHIIAGELCNENVCQLLLEVCRALKCSEARNAGLMCMLHTGQHLGPQQATIEGS